MAKNFQGFLDQLSATNATLDYYVDFEKVKANVDNIKIHLHQLNYLIGQDDLKAAIHQLFADNHKAFAVLDILIATRRKDKKLVLNDDNEVMLLSDYLKTPELIYVFIEKTGLAKVLCNKHITNLVDYVFGVEVGLDTNARKNRGGTQMEHAVAKVLEHHEIDFEREVYTHRFPDLLSLGEDVKRFDFVIKSHVKTYLIEVNYYNTGGSKLNEIARSYTDIAPKINQYQDYEFVWITDGQGWLSAKNKLEEAYYNIPHVYNLSSISDFIRLIKRQVS